MRVAVEFGGLPAGEVRVEDEAALVDTAQQDHADRRVPRGVGRGQRHAREVIGIVFLGALVNSEKSADRVVFRAHGARVYPALTLVFPHREPLTADCNVAAAARLTDVSERPQAVELRFGIAWLAPRRPGDRPGRRDDPLQLHPEPFDDVWIVIDPRCSFRRGPRSRRRARTRRLAAAPDSARSACTPASTRRPLSSG